MSIYATIMLCVTCIAISIQTSAYAFLPEKYPFNWHHFVAWLFFATAIILWEYKK